MVQASRGLFTQRDDPSDKTSSPSSRDKSPVPLKLNINKRDERITGFMFLGNHLSQAANPFRKGFSPSFTQVLLLLWLLTVYTVQECEGDYGAVDLLQESSKDRG